MASVGSFAMESSFLLHSGNHGRPRLPFFAHRPRNSLDSACLSGATSGHAKVVGKDVAGKPFACTRVTGGCGVTRPRMIERLKATGKLSAEGEDGDKAEDAIQATIEKSKKVLAMQRNLLQRIAERKKIVSSIKNSIIDPENDEVSYEDGESSFPSLGTTSVDDEDTDDDYASSIFSSSNVNLTEDGTLETLPAVVSEDFGEGAKEPQKDLPYENTYTDTLETLPPVISEDFGEGAKEPRKDLPYERTYSGVGSHKQLGDKNSGTVWSDELPAFLSSSSATSNLKDERHEGLKDSSLEVNIEADMPAGEDEKPPPLAGANVMNVILVAAECAPWSKTGGLADVAGALPKALAKRGHRVMVVAPLYGNYAELLDTGVRKRYMVSGQDMEVSYFQAYIDGVDFVFIESPIFRGIENNIYGGNRVDILKRMVLFCKAAVEVPWYVPCGGVCYGDGNLVFIANDWHTALLPVYLKAYYRDNGLMKFTRSMLVIHNIAYQGRGPVDDFSVVGLAPHYLDLFKMYDPVGGEHFNIFAAGLKTADRVVTVSHGYAWELKTPEGGWGLHGILNENDWKLKGIVNGIDTKDWNPQFDVHLKSDGYTNYSLDTLQSGKAQCKEALQKELGLPIRGDVPLIGFIGRLDHQKGVDLIAEAVPWMMGQDVQLVMLGTGRPDLEQMLKHVESQHRDKVRGWVGFSVKMAHRITAGADILLMPSRFEPCGLNQLYAMSYGTVPVVHAVGGLRDTVQPFDPYNESGLGWAFDRAEAGRLIHALGNCLLTYREYKKSWEGIQKRGMMQELGWDHAAERYEEVLVAAKYQW